MSLAGNIPGDGTTQVLKRRKETRLGRERFSAKESNLAVGTTSWRAKNDPQGTAQGVSRLSKRS